MAGSYEKINYSLRPAKSIERKMLCDAFRRLSAFGRVENYQYVGFGSTYFSDFILFHKALGMTNLISIEKDKAKQQRFEFNRPFKCIELKFGESNLVLPTLAWDIRSILWLDYDGKLDSDVLLDIGFFCSHASSGSVICVSVNAHPSHSDDIPADNILEYRLQQLGDAVGEDKVPKNIEATDFGGWGTAKIFRQIIDQEISRTLDDRNSKNVSGNRFIYQQLFNFHYADGTKMLTVGGLLYDEGQKHLVAQCDFQTLSFFRQGDEPYLIEVPNLTYREIRYLDTQLPMKEDEPLTLPGVSKKDIERYAKLYRYFPTFTEADI
jgi:hypothetical protein